MKTYHVIVNTDLCKGCGICVEVCPMKALKLSEMPNEKGFHNPEQIGKCIGCKLCECFCPDFAITISEGANAEV